VTEKDTLLMETGADGTAGVSFHATGIAEQEQRISASFLSNLDFTIYNTITSAELDANVITLNT